MFRGPWVDKLTQRHQDKLITLAPSAQYVTTAVQQLSLGHSTGIDELPSEFVRVFLEHHWHRLFEMFKESFLWDSWISFYEVGFILLRFQKFQKSGVSQDYFIYFILMNWIHLFIKEKSKLIKSDHKDSKIWSITNWALALVLAGHVSQACISWFSLITIYL